MRFLDNRSLRVNLTIATMLTTSIALLLACSAVAVFYAVNLRRSVSRDLSTLATIAGSHSTAALSFKDTEATAEILSALTAEPRVSVACIYARDGGVFATYQRPGLAERLQPPVPGPDGSRISGGRLRIFHSIVLDGEVIGSIYIESDLVEVQAQLWSFALTVGVILLASGFVALLISSRLQRVVIEPIQHLADVARIVSADRSYSVRAVRRGSKEIRLLIDAFNHMLSQIQQRGQELQQQHESLEQEVAARTAMNYQLADAKQKAEEASRIKSEFLANMSHEIRTPMNGILGMSELALDTKLTTEQREYLEMVHSSADSLLNIINDILDFSKIEVGKMEIEALEFDVTECVGTTMKALAVRAHQKGLEVIYRMHPDVPEHLVGDAGRLRQLLVNLVGNAIKFTEVGEVVVEVGLASGVLEPSAAPEGAGRVSLHISVRDTGIGIAAEKQALIFDAFTQADGSSTRRFGGTGLGLTISVLLAQLMGGRIWVESELGCGSVFHFTASFGRVQKSARQSEGGPARRPAASIPTDLRGSIALVVDDNATSRQMLCSDLQRWGLQPVAVDTSERALAELSRARRLGTPYRFLLVNATMPGMDGFTLVERIRKGAEPAPPVVMLLGSAHLQADLARCGALGVDAHLMKPIRPSELLEALVKATQSVAAFVRQGATREPRRTAGTTTLPATGGTGSRLRVLLAEDNPVNRILALRMLEKWGHAVVAVSDGLEALAALRGQTFDLLLSDVQMPGMDGFELAAAIRQEEAASGQHLPIVASTAHALQGDLERCLAAGMDAYVSKPFRPEELQKTIEALVRELKR
jgi:signal transduction histidine kinase/CheY-like chemotaxis protein